MPQKALRNYFVDPFEDVSTEVQPRPAVPKATPKSEFIETTYTDSRTGATYKVKERAPVGPQGDFRVPQNEADSRFRQVMGLPLSSFQQRPIDDPFESEHVQPEKSIDSNELEEKIRQRFQFDARRDALAAPSRETASWAVSDEIEDHGDYYIDTAGAVHDKKYNTRGPYGTEEIRAPFEPAKKTKESVGTHRPNRNAIKVQNAGSAEAHKTFQDSLQERLQKQDKLQDLLQNAYRGLFGVTVANNLITKSDPTDGRVPAERPSLDRVVQDAGLLKPWVPPSAKTDRPQKPDQVAFSVGTRVVSHLMTQKLVPELVGLPKADLDDITILLGRTVLNAMTVLPDRKAGDSPVVPENLRLELEKVVSTNVSPNILRGLVPQEWLRDRVEKANPVNERVSGVSNKQVGLPMRKPQLKTELRGAEPKEDGTSTTQPVKQTMKLGPLAYFSDVSQKEVSKRKNLFDQDLDDIDESLKRHETNPVLKVRGSDVTPNADATLQRAVPGTASVRREESIKMPAPTSEGIQF